MVSMALIRCCFFCLRNCGSDDPFSHPYGSSATGESDRKDRSGARCARAQPALRGSGKHSVPGRVHSILKELWLARGSRLKRWLLASNPLRTHGTVESPLKPDLQVVSKWQES